MTVEEVAQELGLSERTVRWRIKEKLIPAEKVGRDWVIERAVIEDQPKGRQKPGPKGSGK